MFTNYSEAELVSIFTRALKEFGHPAKLEDDDQQFITIKEAGQILRVTRQTIHNLIREGQLTQTKIGKSTRLYRAEVLSIPKRA